MRVTVVAVAMLPAFLLGCRAESGQSEPDRTIIVRDATGPSAPRGHGSGDGSPDRVHVVVTEPNKGVVGGGGGSGTEPSSLAQLVGRSVKVQFRRDALGVAAPAPIPPTGQGPGGRAVHLAGIVRLAAPGWLVIERDRTTHWIPYASILMIEVPDAPTTGSAGE